MAEMKDCSHFQRVLPCNAASMRISGNIQMPGLIKMRPFLLHI